ncbi:hypothetical protein RA264_28520, partial [Pseudomonas syringae pv. tagetis]
MLFVGGLVGAGVMGCVVRGGLAVCVGAVGVCVLFDVGIVVCGGMAGVVILAFSGCLDGVAAWRS